jgi:hypothetical protein
MQCAVKRADPATAERIVEQLRYGVPPPERIRAFTVGREEQFVQLERSLGSPTTDRGAALLVRANYGAGKSHLLKVVREMALDAGYAVSLVVVNAQGGVRFNRMDTILGGVCRELEVDHSGRKGVGELFSAFARTPGARLTPKLRAIRDRISNRGRWDYSDYLRSAAVYVALRAWVASESPAVRDVITDWFANPSNYRGQRKLLYERLVEGLRDSFRDPRRDWQFYAEEVFVFHTSGYRQAWDALADLDLIARASGLRGLVLLFDEFEDVVQGLNRRDLQEQAFLNLFRFFAGDRYPGMSYFAVTPDFVRKCKTELLQRGVHDFDYQQFDRLPAFELDPIERDEFLALADRIRAVYGLAYECDAERLLPDEELTTLVDALWTVESPERVRRAIQGVVQELDDRLHAEE